MNASLGGKADSVLALMNISEVDRKKYLEVIGKFDSYFRVRHNVIFERARFNRRSQKEGETLEQYITELYTLIEFCEYGDLKEEMLSDRLVVGICDATLSEKLQTDPDLTPERAKRMIRQKEVAREHRRELRKSLHFVRSAVQTDGPSSKHLLAEENRSTRWWAHAKGSNITSVVNAVELNMHQESGAQLWVLCVVIATEKVISV